MKRFLKFLFNLFFKPFSSLVYISSEEKSFRYINKHKWIKVLIGIIIAGAFIFTSLILPFII